MEWHDAEGGEAVTAGDWQGTTDKEPETVVDVTEAAGGEPSSAADEPAPAEDPAPVEAATEEPSADES
jgi:hypothetical protein